MERIKELENTKRIRIYDYTDYEPSLCNNGGAYLFWTEYRKVTDGKWEVSYGTSADFEYCSCCGTFGNCCCSEEDYDVVTTEVLLEQINFYSEQENYEVEFK